MAEQDGLAESILRHERRIILALVAALFVLAGLYTVFGLGMRMSALQMTAMRGMADMPGPVAPGDWSLGYAVLVVLMWWVMMTAMMLPSVAPTVLLYAALLRRGAHAARVPAISSAFLFGYLSAWAGFSLLAALTQWALEAAGYVSATMMTLIDTVPGAVVLVAAGAFQFTSLKRSCLNRCRSPAEFITGRRRPGAMGAVVMGLEHGAYCLGCCWFLMALLFVGGVMNLYWIVALTALVALEKLTPFGEVVAKVAGAGFAVWGAYLLLAAV